MSVGLKHDITFIPLIRTKKYDVGISKDKFEDRSMKTFKHRADYILDRTTLHREDFLSNNDKYCGVKWSPIGCMRDGRFEAL